MHKEIDASEDARDALEKELEGTKSLLAESVDERARLEVETEQLKTLLKREIDKLETDLATKINVIAEYKVICSQLSDKLEKAQDKLTQITNTNTTDGEDGAQTAKPEQVNGDKLHGSGVPSGTSDERIKELELELAKAKLALVETECKNQDLTHQFNALQLTDGAALGGPPDTDRRPSLTRGGNKWLSKTLSSIR